MPTPVGFRLQAHDVCHPLLLGHSSVAVNQTNGQAISALEAAILPEVRNG
jgi:hypothetical protein